MTSLDNLLLNMQGGLLPEHLTRSEVEVLEDHFGPDWFENLGYTEPKYKKPFADDIKPIPFKELPVGYKFKFVGDVYGIYVKSKMGDEDGAGILISIHDWSVSYADNEMILPLGPAKIS